MMVKRVSGCERDRVKLRCEGGKRIEIVKATYGRLVADRCTTVMTRKKGLVDIRERFLENTSCSSATATSTVGKRCDGKKRCNVGINNRILGDPCVGTFKYSDIDYKCQGISKYKVYRIPVMFIKDGHFGYYRNT